MATQTTNYGLTKSARSENADISVLNGNMDKIDTALNNLSNAVAIIQRTDTATQDIAANAFVIWKGNLCRASSAITSGDTLSVSNLTAITGGGLGLMAPGGMEVLERTYDYSISSNQSESWVGMVVRNTLLAGRKIWAIVGFETNSSRVAISSCHFHTPTGQDPEIDVNLRNLGYPNSGTSNTLRIKFLVG